MAVRTNPCLYDEGSCPPSFIHSCSANVTTGICLHKCDADDKRSYCGDHGTCFYDPGNNAVACRSVQELILSYFKNVHIILRKGFRIVLLTLTSTINIPDSINIFKPLAQNTKSYICKTSQRVVYHCKYIIT